MLAVEENSMWFKTCWNYFSKQYKMYCIRLMGHIKIKPEVAPIFFLPHFSGVKSITCLFWISFRGCTTVAGSPSSEVCLHNTCKLSLKGYRWQLHHLSHECPISYIWSLHGVRKLNSVRKKKKAIPIKGFLLPRCWKIYVLMLVNIQCGYQFIFCKIYHWGETLVSNVIKPRLIWGYSLKLNKDI